MGGPKKHTETQRMLWCIQWFVGMLLIQVGMVSWLGHCDWGILQSRHVGGGLQPRIYSIGSSVCTRGHRVQYIGLHHAVQLNSLYISTRAMLVEAAYYMTYMKELFAVVLCNFKDQSPFWYTLSTSLQYTSVNRLVCSESHWYFTNSCAHSVVKLQSFFVPPCLCCS